ncbi:MAG: glycosyltransferase family 2 protein [Proteobacteria bacterium]|nr:MAG: glycosyltransferase family 2 protein [Pseudomonadota bacterium]
MKIALCLLTKNELPCLEIVFPMLPPAGPDAGFDFVYAVDGGSTDGTIEFYQRNSVPVLNQSKKGRGEAFHTAFREIDADAFIFFSPDGNEDPKDLPKFRRFLEAGADIVIASRMMAGAVNEEDAQVFKWRKWANNAFNLFVNIFFRRNGPYITDTINGYRAITKAAALSLDLDAVDYTIEYQMSIRGLNDGLKIVEFATHEGQRVAGETGAPSFQTGVKFIKRFWVEWLRRSSRRDA